MDLADLKDSIIKAIKDEWMLAGHSLSGAFEKSLEAKYSRTDSGFRIEIFGNEYGIYTSTGVKSTKIPYQRGSGKKGSKYITGLLRYVQARMGISNEREALGIAFAIATKHKAEGMKGSGYLDKIKDKHLSKIEEVLNVYFSKKIEETL
jgi:hypothetical protein